MTARFHPPMPEGEYPVRGAAVADYVKALPDWVRPRGELWERVAEASAVTYPDELAGLLDTRRRLA